MSRKTCAWPGCVETSDPRWYLYQRHPAGERTHSKVDGRFNVLPACDGHGGDWLPDYQLLPQSNADGEGDCA